MANQTQDLEQRAREALGFIEITGIDSFGTKERVNYGLEHGLYTQAQVDAVQEKYKTKRAIEALGFIEITGIDSFGTKERVNYGLEHGLYTQAEVDKAQKKYLDKIKK